MHRVLISFVVGLGAVAAPLASQDSVVAFTGVTVIPMDRERTVENQTVVVRGGRIAAMGPTASTPVPAGATRVDGRGKYLIPGLAEMHAHIPTPQVETPFRADGAYAESVLKLYVANGVTTIRGMLGHPSHLALRERVRAGALIGPTIYTSGPSFNGNSAPDPATARRMVLEQRVAGYDFLKIHPGLSRDTFDTLARLADSVGVRFAGHVPAGVGLERALEARYASIDHMDGFTEYLAGWLPADGTPAGFFGFNISDRADESKLAGIARRTREAGVWIVPTQALMDGFVSAEDAAAMGRRPEMRYLPKPLVAQWVQAKKNAQAQPTYDAERARRFIALRGRIIKGLHGAGVGIALGSDAPQVMNVPGFSAHRELAVMVAAGLTPYQALETGTRNIAAYFGTLDRSGTVAAGKVADLVLLDANPLTDIANTTRIAGVMTRGRWMPRATLDVMLSGIAAAWDETAPE
jgi:imidazolonepropionase-like amidohydrolase